MAINKIKEEELKSLQEKVGIQQNLQLQVGQLELQKFFLLNSAAKNQQENLNEGQTLSKEDDLTDVVADIVTKADNDTAAKVLETLNDASEDTDSKLSLSVVENLTKKDNYEEKIEILSNKKISFIIKCLKELIYFF